MCLLRPPTATSRFSTFHAPASSRARACGHFRGRLKENAASRTNVQPHPRLGVAAAHGFVPADVHHHDVPQHAGGQTGLKFDEAVLQGLATDRGLLVPEQIPSFPPGAPEVWRGLKFEELAYEIMSLYIGPKDIEPDVLKDIINRSYATFRDPAEEPHPHSSAEDKNGRVTPVREITDGMHVLELFHGPTFAFKDVALQYLGNLFEQLLKKRPGHSITVVGATSGDTGSSAIHGLRGKDGVECFIMYPEGRTSRTQELQMITVTDPNIHNIALGGTFDDCQAVVKACFNDAEFRDAHNLAAVNSINWARILAQMVYYVYAYLKVTPPPASAKDVDSPPLVSFSVPTGNFGDILAGYYAKAWGAD